MAKKDKFPQVLYAKLSVEGGEEYVNAGTELTGLTEMGETSKFGVYTLTEIVEVEGRAFIVRR